VACMGKGRGVYRVLVGRPEGKGPLGRPRRRWEDNIQLDIKELEICGAKWIQLARDRVQRPILKKFDIDTLSENLLRYTFSAL